MGWMLTMSIRHDLQSIKCRRIDLFHIYPSCEFDKKYCDKCLCWSCESNHGYCTAKLRRWQNEGDQYVGECAFYRSINPPCEPEDYELYKSIVEKLAKDGVDNTDVYTWEYWLNK